MYVASAVHDDAKALSFNSIVGLRALAETLAQTDGVHREREFQLHAPKTPPALVNEFGDETKQVDFRSFSRRPSRLLSPFRSDCGAAKSLANV